MPEIYGSDAYSPREIADRIESVGVRKASLPLLPMTALGVLAGGFIGLGVLYFNLVASDPALGFEHSIANMYFVPLAIFPAGEAAPHHLTWGAFFLHHLLSVTLGNIVGGAGFVGLVYHLIYERE